MASVRVCRRWFVALVLAAVAGAGGLPSAQRSEARRILVVVNNANPVESLDLGQVRRVFLREQAVWPNGWPVVVFERSSDDPIRAQFSLAALGKTPSELAEHWLNLALTRGFEPPKVCRTALLVQQYIDRAKGGVSYVFEEELAPGMKVVARVTPKGRSR